MTKSVIQLLRVSTQAQAGEDRASIPAQKTVCAKIAQQYGLTIVGTVELVDVSGASILKAPEMVELLETIQRGELHGVVAREFSRLMRPENFADFVILQTFAESKTLLYLPDGPMDFASKSGRLLGTIRAAMAGMERTEISERIASAKEQMRREGKWPNAEHILPFGVGYERETSRWYYKPEAEKVREVFHKFLSGDQNYDGLARVLGTPRNTVRNILSNPIYMGTMVYDQKRDPSPSAKRLREGGRQGDRRKIARSPEEVIRVRVIEEGLISEGEFARAQLMIREKGEYHIRLRQKVGQFVYAGFVWCGECDDRLHTFRNQFDKFYYVCSNRKRKNDAGEVLCPDSRFMNRDRLEPMLDEIFGSRLSNPRFLRQIYDYQTEQLNKGGSESRVLRLRQQVERLGAKRQRVTDLFIEGELSREDRLQRLAQLDRELRHAKDQLAAESPVPSMDAAGLARVFAPFMRWSFLRSEDKRRLLTSLMARVQIANYQVLSLSGIVGSQVRAAAA